jgi:protein ImuB
MTRRILSAWLPHWPITRLSRTAPAAPGRPLVTVEAVHGVRRLAAVGAPGEAAGLRSGQTLADARAVCPGLVAVDADPAADQAALERLAAWAERYTPMAAADPPDGLWLDITGCAHLSGGEATLADDLSVRLARNGIPSRLAIAGATGAAWALAHAWGVHGWGDAPGGEVRKTARENSGAGEAARGEAMVLPPGQERAALAPLPVALLRLDPRTVAGLRRLGIRQVRDLLRLPRGDITARFGAAPVVRLDQALGTAAEAIAWPRPPIDWFERIAFVEPIGTPEDLTRALTLLAERLCRRLADQHSGVQRVTARFFRVDGAVPRIAIGTAQPVREAAYLARLLGEKLDTIDPGFGVEAMTLEADDVVPLPAPQLSSLAAPDGAGQLATTVDRLANRLGPERVWRPAPHASHVPERAVQRVPPLPVAQPAWVADPTLPRPIRLLRRPEAIEATAPVPDDPPIVFRWRGAPHRVRAAAGPERIAAEWWRRQPGGARPETDLVRDYYRVEDTEGARFWIFRAGLYRSGETPRWYMHGLFA